MYTDIKIRKSAENVFCEMGWYVTEIVEYEDRDLSIISRLQVMFILTRAAILKEKGFSFFPKTKISAVTEIHPHSLQTCKSWEVKEIK